ncbi:MAG: hypothetical protein JNL39_11070 [Opitutaceae bacterium]|nr:hypothetical protein [Opitutaceae bacterium]
MNSLFKSPIAIGIALAVSAAVPARAVTVAEFTAGTAIASNLIGGQSFTLVGAGSFTNISFNFFSDTPATTPSAAGTGFLLSSAYTGTPGALSSGTAGYLGSATASGGFWNFGSGVSLLGGTQYFFYANTATLITGSNLGGYGGGNYYNGSSGSFVSSAVDANFRVTGDAVSAPDGGSTMLMFALGGLGLLLGRRSLRSAAS